MRLPGAKHCGLFAGVLALAACDPEVASRRGALLQAPRFVALTETGEGVDLVAGAVAEDTGRGAMLEMRHTLRGAAIDAASVLPSPDGQRFLIRYSVPNGVGGIDGWFEVVDRDLQSLIDRRDDASAQDARQVCDLRALADATDYIVDTLTLGLQSGALNQGAYAEARPGDAGVLGGEAIWGADGAVYMPISDGMGFDVIDPARGRITLTYDEQIAYYDTVYWVRYAPEGRGYAPTGCLGAAPEAATAPRPSLDLALDNGALMLDGVPLLPDAALYAPLTDARYLDLAGPFPAR